LLITLLGWPGQGASEIVEHIKKEAHKDFRYPIFGRKKMRNDPISISRINAAVRMAPRFTPRLMKQLAPTREQMAAGRTRASAACEGCETGSRKNRPGPMAAMARREIVG